MDSARLQITRRRRRLIGSSVAAVAAVAALASASPALRTAQPLQAFVSPALVASAQSHPQTLFHVILRGRGTTGAGSVVAAINQDVRGKGVGLGRRLMTIDGASATVTGRQLVALAGAKGVAAIALD